MFETIDLTQYLMACGLLFGILIAFYCAMMLVQRYRVHGHFKPTAKRLQIVETLPLNARQKMFIIRQDGIDHTVILGGQSDLHLGSMEAPTSAIATDNLEQAPSANPIGFLKTLPDNEKSAKKASSKPTKKKKKETS